MARWLEAEQHAEWELMEWCLGDCVPGLLQACRMVPPACEVESLRCALLPLPFPLLPVLKGRENLFGALRLRD